MSAFLRPRPALAAGLWLLSAATQAQPLPQLYQAALLRDPAVAGARAQLQAAEQRVVQARAGFGPSANITASTSATRYREGPAFDAMRPFHGTQAALQITQPLFRPALLPALDAALAQQLQAEAALAQARSEAAQRLVEAGFDLLKARDALALSLAQQAAVAEQLLAARRSYELGTAAVTDLREAEAKADLVAAQIAASEAELELRREVLAELVGPAADGGPPGAGLLARALDGDRLPPLAGADALAWLARAQDGSAQLAQARQALVAAEAELRRAWLGHSPTAELSYNYTMSRDTGTVTSFFPRDGDSSTLGVNVTVPLFASGATQARVREASAQRDKAAADVELARRTVTLGVRQGFSAALAAIAQARALDLAQRSQALSLRANQRGYEVGMKVNAEVLDAQSRLFEVRRDLARARYDAWLAYARLQALGGTLGEAELAQLDGLLVDAVPQKMMPARPSREMSR